MRLAESPPTERLANCCDVTLIAGDSSYALSDLTVLGRVRIGVRSRNMLEGRIPSTALEKLVAGSQNALVVCGERWLVPDATREQLQNLLNSLHRSSTGDEAPAVGAP